MQPNLASYDSDCVLVSVEDSGSGNEDPPATLFSSVPVSSMFLFLLIFASGSGAQVLVCCSDAAVSLIVHIGSLLYGVVPLKAVSCKGKHVPLREKAGHAWFFDGEVFR
jgi:hypothetical protein